MNATAEIHVSTAAGWFADELARLTLFATVYEEEPVLIERSGRRGEMAPLHSRDDDEVYRVTEGDITFFVGDEGVPASAGDVVVAPADVPRTFCVESEDARWLVLTRVTSVEHYREFARALAVPFDPGSDCPADDALDEIEGAAAVNGIDLIAPPGTLPGRPR